MKRLYFICVYIEKKIAGFEGRRCFFWIDALSCFYIALYRRDVMKNNPLC